MCLRGVVLNTDGQICLDHTVQESIKTQIDRDHRMEKSFTTSKSGVVVDSIYTDEFNKAESLGEQLAVALIGLGADDILREVRANMPNVSNIQLPTKPSDTIKW